MYKTACATFSEDTERKICNYIRSYETRYRN